jgi:hypothetical protein
MALRTCVTLLSAAWEVAFVTKPPFSRLRCDMHAHLFLRILCNATEFFKIWVAHKHCLSTFRHHALVASSNWIQGSTVSFAKPRFDPRIVGKA